MVFVAAFTYNTYNANLFYNNNYPYETPTTLNKVVFHKYEIMDWMFGE